MKRIGWLLVALAFLGAGCGSSGGGSGPAASQAVNSNGSVIAIDGQRQLAYVPLPTQNLAGDAQVAVLNLGVDPDTTDPRIATIDLGHAGIARAAAIAPAQGLAMVISGSVLTTGYLDLINESNNTLVSGSPFSFPTGSRPLNTDGIIYDPVDNTALVSMTGTPVACSDGIGTACTGMAKFSLTKDTFGPLIQFNNPVDSFGFDPMSGIALAPTDETDPVIGAVNTKASAACTLTDDNLTGLDADPDGAAADPSTGIWVVGNYGSTEATVINLAGASFTGTPPSCMLQEGGTPPNSVNFDLSTAFPLPGVALNSATHQAFLTSAQSSEIGLLSLPSAPVTQLSASSLSAVNATLPASPNGNAVEIENFPYADAIDASHNRAYFLDDTFHFLIEVDLTKLKSDPSAISTPLVSGGCAGTSTPFGCDNNNGVRFFPLPGT